MEFDLKLLAIGHLKHSLRKRPSLMPCTISKYILLKVCIFPHTMYAYFKTRRPWQILWIPFWEKSHFRRQPIFGKKYSFFEWSNIFNCHLWTNVNPYVSIKTKEQYSWKTDLWCENHKNKIFALFFENFSMQIVMYDLWK